MLIILFASIWFGIVDYQVFGVAMGDHLHAWDLNMMQVCTVGRYVHGCYSRMAGKESSETAL